VFQRTVQLVASNKSSTDIYQPEGPVCHIIAERMKDVPVCTKHCGYLRIIFWSHK